MNIATDHSRLDALFAAIDRMDADAFGAFFAADGAFRFGNAPPVSGREAVIDAVRGFFSSIARVSHHLADRWETPEQFGCHGTVTYTRHDGSTLTVPFANVMYKRNGLIGDYLIFADTSALYAPAPAA